MGELHGTELTKFLLGLAVLLGSAHLLGDLFKRMGQPTVVGEMCAGLLLGPTFFGWIAPEAQEWLFPHNGAAATALDGIVILAVTLLLLVAGMEVDLSSVFRQGREAVYISLLGVLIPLVAGAAVAWFAPSFWGMPDGGDPATFAMLFGTAIAVCALPIIAKILLDLDLFQSDFGVLVLVAATLNNLIAWLIFAVVLSEEEGGMSTLSVVLLTVGFAVGMLTIGRWVADRCLSWAQAHLSWPSGVLGFALVAGLLGGAVTDALGVHAIFGAFLTGIALGESPHMREQTRHVVHRFVEGFLAPIFVAAIGLEVNFIANFSPLMVISVLLFGIGVKTISVWGAARMAGCQPIEAWGAGWALNARGELGIVLGLLAWEAHAIREDLFVSLVVMAMLTSALAGPMLSWLLRREKPLSLGSLIDAKSCIPNLEGSTAEEVIRTLSKFASERVEHSAEEVARAVLAREEIMGTGLGRGIAVPHARLHGLTSPLVLLGVSSEGVSFLGLDDEPAKVIFLILTPDNDPLSQLQILAEIGRFSHHPDLVKQAMAARNATDLIGAIRVAEALLKDEKDKGKEKDQPAAGS